MLNAAILMAGVSSIYRGNSEIFFEVSNLAEIIIGKQRHGPTGNIMLEFEAMFTKFKDTQNT